MTMEQVDGGPDYYGRFAHPFPSSGSFFPVGVWFESVNEQGDVQLDKDAGLNTYVVLGADSDMSLVRSNGMHALVQQSERDKFSGIGSETTGWELEDEIDMMREPAAGCAELKRDRDSLPADGRLRFNNFGKGVTFWESDREASCYVNAVDLASADIYWFTDPGVCDVSEGGALFAGAARALTAAECRRASNYGATVTRMRSLIAPARSRPVWAFVEVGHPFSEGWAPTITGPQLRAAVWHSLIAKARGLIYFNHNFSGPCDSQHVLRDGCGSAIRPTVKAVNAQVNGLAPVLNAPFVVDGWTASPSVKAMVKWDGGHLYLFAGSAENTGSTPTFDLPCVGDATATVLHENRTRPISGGRFTDSFADGNAIHIYRIDGGSSCGLPAVAGQPARGSHRSRRRTAVGKVPRRPRLRHGRLAVPVTCAARCTVVSRLTTTRHSRRVRLAAARHRFAAGRHRLVLHLSKRGRRIVARARKPLAMRLRTVIRDRRGVRTQRTQHLVTRRRAAARRHA